MKLHYFFYILYLYSYLGEGSLLVTGCKIRVYARQVGVTCCETDSLFSAVFTRNELGKEVISLYTLLRQLLKKYSPSPLF